MIPLWVMCVIVVVVFLFTDRRVFKYVDWGLPLTFCMFFIFIGNMKRVPEFYELARSLVGGHPLGTLIASMASLISYKNVVRQYPHKKGRYLAVYSAVNVLFLAVLLTLSWIIEPSL